MQDKFVGDIGDFANNGLLRHLCGKRELASQDPNSPAGKLKLGIVWYINTKETANRDGRYTSYLYYTPQNQERFRKCDPFLYDGLSELVSKDKRTVAALEDSDLLPDGTKYYREPMVMADKQLSAVVRKNWLNGAIRNMAGVDLVFLNPDIGVASEREHIRIQANGNLSSSVQHAYIQELKLFLEFGKSLVVYQHLNRDPGGAASLLRSLSDRIRNSLESPNLYIRAVRFKSFSSRLYLLIANPRQAAHLDFLERRLGYFERGRLWCTAEDPLFMVMPEHLVGE